MKPFKIKVGQQVLIIPFQDMSKTKGVWNFTQEFREAWLQENHPNLLQEYLLECKRHEAVFKTIEQHTKSSNHETPHCNHYRLPQNRILPSSISSDFPFSSAMVLDATLPGYGDPRRSSQSSTNGNTNLSHQKSTSMNPAYQKVIQKYNLMCLQHKVKPNSVALSTSLNIAGFQANDPEDESYRNIAAYSNSRIGAIKDELMGFQKDLPYKAFGLGKIVHQQLLEPHLCGINQYVLLTRAVKRDLQGMVSSAKRHPALRQILAGYQKEQIFTWFDSETGAPCKSKVDLWREKTRGDHVIDLKATRARSQEEFEASAKKYEYDRQGAFYLDGTKAKRFTLYGIQKVAPYAIFHLSITSHEDRIIEARRKYRFIISKAIQNQIQP